VLVSRRNLVSAIAASAVLGLTGTALGCGGSDDGDKTTSTQGAESTTPTQETKTNTERQEQEAKRPIPPSLNTVESAAEDTIDFAHAGNRAKVIATARKLQRTAAGRASADLRKAGVPTDTIRALQDRARLVSSLARTAGFLRLSLGANQVSALMPELFAHYSTPIPPAVQRLDYVDREAQLRSRAGDETSVSAAVDDLVATWAVLKPDVIKAGGAKVAARFSRHVAAMRRLAKGSDAAELQAELQAEAGRGLELVDRLEETFRGQ
jgi:hypothetical protein